MHALEVRNQAEMVAFRQAKHKDHDAEVSREMRIQALADQLNSAVLDGVLGPLTGDAGRLAQGMEKMLTESVGLRGLRSMEVLRPRRP